MIVAVVIEGERVAFDGVASHCTVLSRFIKAESLSFSRLSSRARLICYRGSNTWNSLMLNAGKEVRTKEG